MGSDNSLCWTQAIDRGAGRHRPPLIIAFPSLATLGFLYASVGGFWWKGGAYGICPEAAFAYFCFCLFTLEVCWDGFGVVNGRGSVKFHTPLPPTSSPPPPPVYKFITCININQKFKNKIKTFSNLHLSYHNWYFHNYIWTLKNGMIN